MAARWRGSRRSYERNQASRDDLVQEIALALWRALPTFRGECSGKTLVFRIAHNRALTHLQRTRRGVHLEIDDAAHVADRRATPDVQATTGELRERLMEAIQELPFSHRQVMVLLLEGMTHAEISDVMGITETNVAVRATRARKALRERLGDMR